MSSYVDFEDVKKCYSIVDVAERLGLELKKSGNQLRGACFSGAEGDRKLCITPSKGAWYSFALNEGGDVISLVARVRDCSAKEAAQWITGDTEPEKKKRSKRTSSQGEKSSEGFSPLEYLVFDHPSVEAIGLDAATARKLGCGFCPRGIYRGKVAWPVRNEAGTLIGYIAFEEVQLPPKWHF